jgi:Homing endonuclease associated repeat
LNIIATKFWRPEKTIKEVGQKVQVARHGPRATFLVRQSERRAGDFRNWEQEMQDIETEKQKITDAIQKTAPEVGGAPTQDEFRKGSGISIKKVIRLFGTWKNAIDAAGLESSIHRPQVDNLTLLEDWGRVVRQAGSRISKFQYKREGSHSHESLVRRFGNWSRLPEKFKEFAKGREEWRDVVEVLNSTRVRGTRKESEPGQEPQPLYSNQLNCPWMRHEPTNETGVIFLFGVLAPRLGYMVETIRVGFPDCEAKKRIV